MMNTRLGFFLIFLLVGCSSKDDATPNLKGEYHLNILYGKIENYTGNDGQWLNVYQAESKIPTQYCEHNLNAQLKFSKK